MKTQIEKDPLEPTSGWGDRTHQIKGALALAIAALGKTPMKNDTNEHAAAVLEQHLLEMRSEPTLVSLLRGYVELIEEKGDESAKAVAEGLCDLLGVTTKAEAQTDVKRPEWRVSDQQMLHVITMIHAHPTEFPRGRDLGHSIINAAVRSGLFVPTNMSLEDTIKKPEPKKADKPVPVAQTPGDNMPQKESWRDRIVAASRDLGEFNLADIYRKIEASSPTLPANYQAKVRQVIAGLPNTFEKIGSGRYRLKDINVTE